MEALTVAEIPAGPEWQYEPKWDGFRCLAFRDGREVELQSKAGQPLARYFPELAEDLLRLKAAKFVLDGEIVVTINGRLSFDDLLQRIHPAESRIRKLAAEHPSTFMVFDLLVDDRGEPLTGEPLEERRRRLELFAGKYLEASRHIRLSPATRQLAVAREWYAGVGASLDGVVAKPAREPYQSGERTMRKIKKLRTVDCVVGGFRYAQKERVVGSLLLGLYDESGILHHVGFTSSMRSAERKELTAKLKRLIAPPGFTGRAPGGPSRWSGTRNTEWQPLKPKLVVEVEYDHFTGGRFRHGTRFVRWRPDKAPRQCTMDQVEALQPIFGITRGRRAASSLPLSS